jgi:hypothetical protein
VENSSDGELLPGHQTARFRQVASEKTASFLSFPYVCPEPVLVKECILYINGPKMAVFLTGFPPPSRVVRSVVAPGGIRALA